MSTWPCAWLGGDYAGLLPGLPPADRLDFGALVEVAEVVGCVSVERVEGDPFAVGPWCWLLAEARRIPPVPFKGQLGLFDVPGQFALCCLECQRASGPDGALQVWESWGFCSLRRQTK